MVGGYEMVKEMSRGTWLARVGEEGFLWEWMLLSSSRSSGRGRLLTPVYLSPRNLDGALGVSLEKVSTGDQVTVGLTAVCSFPVLTETRFPPEFAPSLLSSSLNQLRQEVNDQKSLGDLVGEENKGQNVLVERGYC